MCGIYISEYYDNLIIQMISNRGQDIQKCIKYTDLYLYSSVLSIRSRIEQPLVTKKFALFYNGEIYNGQESDTLYLKNIIENILVENVTNEDDFCELKDPNDFLQQLHSKISIFQNEMALAVVFKNVVVFFKDDVGKKSLGMSFKKGFCLSSVCYDEELNSGLFYSYDIKQKTLQSYEKKKVSIKYLLEYQRYIQQYLDKKNDLLNEFLNLKLDNQTDTKLDVLDDVFFNSFKRRLVDGNLVVFFSGGVDSVVVALYLHLVSLPSQTIFLINTGFPNSFDRTKGRTAFDELQKIFPERRFVFKEVDLDIEDIKLKVDQIRQLIYPKHSKMDINIGIILYYTSVEARKYSKICYLGSGADELFGGYSKYKKDSCRNRMLFDTLTLSYHNLTRDDRIISNNNLEGRLPLLDTEIINLSFLSTESVNNKIIIRRLLDHHGLVKISQTPKKAMQYGSGLCKYENKFID